MIETIRKDRWQADDAVQARLIAEYLESVTTHGVNCTGLSCGNARLLRYVMEEAARTGVPAPVIDQARAAFQQAMGRTIEDAATELEAFVRANDARADAERAANRELVARLPAREAAAPP